MSSPFSDERWGRLSPYLDQALELDAERRVAWLAELRAGEPEVAAELGRLLAEHEAAHGEGFLEPESAPTPPTLAGQRIGAYTLRSPLGQGGMGSVWLAERSDGHFEGAAAVKLLNASLVGRGGEERFRQEGSILARLRHPRIAHLVDAGVTPHGQPYLVLEHVAGTHVDAYCDARRLGVEARIRLFLDVVEAVGHAHAHLVVHRDIKPSNVLVTEGGEVKLLDFGIAKLLEPEGAPTLAGLTREGEVAMTPEYAAPEQLTGGEVTTATDVYSLGVLLFVLLTGQHPSRGRAGTTTDFLLAIVDADPPRPSDAVVGRLLPEGRRAEVAAARATTPERLRARLRGDLDNIVARALKKRPAERYPSVLALAEDLRRHLRHQPVTARRDAVSYRARKFARRHRAAVAMAGLVAVAVAAGMAGTLTQAARAREQAAEARAQRARAEREARAAAEQRDFALRELSRAEAINDLNSFLLSDAAPLGKPFTAGELLARAERVVERQTGEALDNRVEILVALGRQHLMLDEHEAARRVLARAHGLAGEGAEPSTRAKAACALAAAVAAGGESERAEGLLAEADRLLPRAPQYDLHRVFCLMRASEVAQDRGDADVGLSRAEEAGRLLAASGAASPLLELRVAMKLAESNRLLGRQREAAAAFAAAFARLEALGRDDTEMAGTLLNNWGLNLAALGRPLAARELLERAVAISSADGGDANVSPMLLNNLARVLRDLDRLDAAGDHAERAYRRARDLGQQAVVSQNLLLRTSIHRLAGQPARAAATLAEAEPVLRGMLPAGHIAFAALDEERALLAAAVGDTAAALAAADRALAIAETSPQREYYLSRLLLTRSQVALAAGRLERARSDAERALALEVGGIGPEERSSGAGLAYLALGRALAAEGRTAEAGAAASSALAHLEPALGAAHRLTSGARELAAVPTARARN